MENYFLCFIEDLNNVAAQNAKMMEKLLYEDSSSSIIKARIFAEEILKDVFNREELVVPYISKLHEKVTYLSRIGIFDQEIQRSFDTIRLAGNKAAHDGEFNDLTKAIKLHRVMYDIAVWYFELYSDPNEKVPLYEHPKPSTSNNINELDIQNIIKKEIQEFLQHRKQEEQNVEPRENEEEKNVTGNSTDVDEERIELEIDDELPEGESYLINQLKKLQESSQEAVENADTFSSFKKYLHVERKIQNDLEHILKENKDTDLPNLILLCGSVGDGKSHLLAYLKENTDLIKNYEIYNDATESFSPEKDAMETLVEILSDFSDQKIGTTNKKVIIAINMGVLHNFVSRSFDTYTFQTLRRFVANSGLFSEDVRAIHNERPFSVINFGDYHTFELTEKGPKSDFFRSLLNKVFSKTDQNPFYLAYKKDLDNGIRTIIHENYEFMQDEFVRIQIVNLTIQSLLKFKLVISARAFLNFISDILIPENINSESLLTELEKLEYSVPSLLFNNEDRSILLRAMSRLDPLHYRSKHVDQLIIELNTLSNWEEIINKYVKSSVAKSWLLPLVSDEHLKEHSFNIFTRSVIRIAFSTNQEFSNKIKDLNFNAYINNLYYFNTGDLDHIKIFYEDIKQSIFKWKGSPKKGYTYLSKPDDRYRIAQSLNLKPYIKHFQKKSDIELSSFRSTILLGYQDTTENNTLFLEIDFPLYSLLMRVKDGYCPNKKDEEDAIRFVEFLDKAMKYGYKREELLFHFPSDNRFYKLSKDDFGMFVFEREL